MIDLNQLFFKYCVYYPVVCVQGENVFGHLNSLRKTQWAKPDQLRDIQNRKLSKLLTHAKATIPYYRNRLECIDVEHQVGEQLGIVPVLTKADLQINQELFVQPNMRSRLKRKTTGGTTGQPVFIWKTKEAIALENAANWRGFEWAGIDIGHRQGRFWGVPLLRKDRLRARIADFVVNRERCSAFSFSPEDMKRYTMTLNRFRPHYLYGYVSMLTAYAEYLRDSEMRLKCDLSAVVCTAEVLTPYHRKLFAETFGARVYNEYGCGELGTIAHECENGSMHINAENLIVEIARDSRPCQPGEIGEVIVTELNNSGMPLVRYRLGDFASFSRKVCSCGRTLPVIENVVGRAWDIIYNREGEMFHGAFFLYVFEEVKRNNLGIRNFQVIQEDFDNLAIRVVVNERYGSETESLVRTLIQHSYGSYVQIRFIQVSEILREPSGKMRLVVRMPSAKPIGETKLS